MGWAGEGPRLPELGRASIGAGGQGAALMNALVYKTHAGEMAFGGPGMRELFNGWVSSVKSGFGRRGGGRRLWIEATSGDVKGLSKETQTQTYGEGKKSDDPASADGAGGSPGAGPLGIGFPMPSPSQTQEFGKPGGPQILLQTVMEDIFKKAGIRFKASPQMAKIARDFWNIQNQSPQAFASAIARSLGGVFKIENGIAAIVGRFEGVNAEGNEMPTVDAVWGINLIGWRIKPYAGRPQYGGAAARVFDLHKAEWSIISKAISGDNSFFSGAKAIANLIMPVANADEARQSNDGTGINSQSRRGTGWVLLNGEPFARAGGWVIIAEARPGVDGKYLITEAEHNYQRGVGYTTRCNVQYPNSELRQGELDSRRRGKRRLCRGGAATAGVHRS